MFTQTQKMNISFSNLLLFFTIFFLWGAMNLFSWSKGGAAVSGELILSTLIFAVVFHLLFSEAKGVLLRLALSACVVQAAFHIPEDVFYLEMSAVMFMALCINTGFTFFSN